MIDEATRIHGVGVVRARIDHASPSALHVEQGFTPPKMEEQSHSITAQGFTAAVLVQAVGC